MDDRPTKQYLDYLISTYTDIPDTCISEKTLNISQLNISKSEFQYSFSPQVIPTNQCENDNSKSDNSF